MQLENRKNKIIRIVEITLTSVIIFAFLFLIFSSIPKDFDLNKTSVSVLLSFIFNFVVFAAFFIYSLKLYNFSLNSMIWVFSLIFFVLAPLIQYFNNNFLLGDKVETNQILFANFIILLFSVFIEIVYILFHRYLNKRRKEEKFKNISVTTPENHDVIKTYLCILTIVSCVLALIKLLSVGFSGVVVRESDGAFRWLKVDSLILAVESVLKYFVPLVVALNIFNFEKTRTSIMRLVISVVALLIYCFPFALPRYLMATIYGGLVLCLFYKFLKHNKIFILSFILLMFIVYPAMTLLRTDSIFCGNFYSGLINMIKNYNSIYMTGNYDAYVNLIRCISHVEQYGITFGRQLLGVLLFMVPRAIWKSKPIGSGAFVAQNLGETFTNLSMPFVGEGYLNFGLIGVICFAIALGIIIATIDKIFWNLDKGFTKLFYMFSLFLFFFMLRGDLMSSFAYTFAFVITLIVIYVGLFIAVKFSKKRKK